MKEWDWKKNKTDPYKISRGNKKKVYWKDEHGHSWKASILNRTYGSGCTYCKRVVLKSGKSFDSMIEAYYYLKLKQKYKNIFCRKQYPSYKNHNIGRRMYDFYIQEENRYIEVTSFTKNDFLSYKAYGDYIKNIRLKRNYVINVLGAKFDFIQHKLTRAQTFFVKKYVK